MVGCSTGKEYLSPKGWSGRVFSPEQPGIELTRLVDTYILRRVLYEPGAGGSSGRGRSGRCLTAPFGGYKESGIGRENGLETLHEYTQLKTVPTNSPAKYAIPSSSAEE
jgi:hypothetical protein